MTAEESKAKKHAYYLANREHLKAKSQEWRAKNRERILQKMREYYQNNKEKCRNLAKQYFKTYKRPELSPEQKERARVRAMEWRRLNPGASTKQVQDWARRNPEKYRLTNANKYANRKQQGEQSWRMTPYELNDLMTNQEGRCFYCHCSITSHFVIEHKTPLSRGGRHIPANVCLSCNLCNLRKSNKTADEFMMFAEKRGD